ncbi:MAG: hypothetical protein JSS10_03790 [Verrucomicrobia bacterium]|nr:hypothetical protein [Verrucomicrobiota bacterium]
MAAITLVSDQTQRAIFTDRRSALQRTVHLVVSLVKQARYSLAVFLHWHLRTDRPFKDRKLEWKPASDGLVVLVHGLGNSSSSWYSQLSLLSQYKTIDVFAPELFKRGLCSLEEAASPLLPTLLDYIQKNPGKPLCLIGTSNGGRVTAWLETKLREASPQTSVKVSNIAGVHLGSQRMDLLEKLKVSKWFYPAALRQELQYSSSKAKELLSSINTPLPANCAHRTYEFFATTEDLTIPDLDSTLPHINHDKTYHLIHGESHSSIVTAVAEMQIKSCYDWISLLSIA